MHHDLSIPTTWIRVDDPPRTLLAVQRLNIGPMLPQIYTQRFGMVSSTAPWGDQVWQEMASTFNDWFDAASWHRHSPGRFGGPWHAAWFTPPVPFGRRNAQRPLSDPALEVGERYPCLIFIDDTDDTIYMWCLSIVIQWSRWWIVHPSRIVIAASYPAGHIHLELTDDC